MHRRRNQIHNFRFEIIQFQNSTVSLFLLSNQNPLSLGFWFVLKFDFWILKRFSEISNCLETSLSLLKEILNAPWKLNIVIIDAIYEKATVKEKLLINFELKGNKLQFCF